MARRDVPTRIPGGIVEVHVKAAIRSVARVAANDRYRARIIPLYMFFFY